VGSSNDYRVYALGSASPARTWPRRLHREAREDLGALGKSAGVMSPAISQRSSIRCAPTRLLWLLSVRPTYATRRQLPAWMSGAHCSWKVEANPSCH
jgi:hypothetical protein